ncbi:L,D-transpeptidase family protein [Allorhizobium sp. BGMRC 0089]|uniref:L,D-transpeptidase family protein n=1 Tax=Allorhizobium sonneratiae TaxID=2934936 RepID=UPI0020337761|nr:L,D-transpeptidase family protein [Allorhizobium sonneratiae]MCM2292113.1 L,D-transpeptidase family protein [Allorhizobium sonneratiae]
MVEKLRMLPVSRRALLRGAAFAGAATLANSAFAQSAVQQLIQDRDRGNWDDQFDAQTSRAMADVLTNTPMLSASNMPYMQQAIASYQQIVANGGWPQVNPTVKLVLGVSDPSVQVLRQRLMISGDLQRGAGMSSAFDTYVDGALRRFQARHGLPTDGTLGEYTLKAMNVPADIRLNQLNINLVRLQAMSGDLGRRYVEVNIPAAYIEAVEDGRVALRSTAIVGRESRPTPVLNSKIFEVILNPYWTAPRSIIQKDIMPLMQKDPTYLTRNNIRLFDAKGNEVSPDTVDWNAPKAPNLMFRQDPGKINAMASSKVNFHNPYSVYMHDTPEQSLFNKIIRFDSSGCVRVQSIRDLDVWLLKETPGWNRQQIERVIASRVNTPVKLTEEVPVYFVYITAWSAKDGIVQFRDDIYNRDGDQQLALQSNIGVEQNPGAIEDDNLPKQ